MIASVKYTHLSNVRSQDRTIGKDEFSQREHVKVGRKVVVAGFRRACVDGKGWLEPMGHNHDARW
jgi:hypothetical protein